MQRNSVSLSLGDITNEDIRLFRRTLLARRFPQLRDLTDEEIAQLIIADRKATGRRLEAPSKSYPKTDFMPLTIDKDVKVPPPFVPGNYFEARDTISRKPAEAFVGIHSPYPAEHQDFCEDVTNDDSKRCAGVPFRPTCPQEAKSTIQVKYYLNSASEARQKAEREALRAKKRDMMSAYKDNYDTSRVGSRQSTTVHTS